MEEIKKEEEEKEQVEVKEEYEELEEIEEVHEEEEEEKSSIKRSKKIEKAEENIEKEKYDAESWIIIMNEVKNMHIVEARVVYERFLKLFPTASRYWKSYAQHEIESGNIKEGVEIFDRCLLNNLNVELWQYYLNYVKSSNDSVENKDEIEKAFEFALDKVGLDINSTPIWNDYINFVKNQPVSNQFDQSKIMIKLRSLYQRAISNCMNGIDVIWHEYEAFENEISPTLAKTLIAENLIKYKSSVSKLKEKKILREGLLINMLATPPTTTTTFNLKEEEQKQIWKRLIDFEERNTQKLSINEVYKNVSFTYSQCLLCFYHHTDIWYSFTQYYIKHNLLNDASEIYEKSIQCLPDNLLLHLAYSEFEELRKNLEKSKEIFERLIQHRKDSLSFIQYQNFLRRTEGSNPARNIFMQARKSNECTYHIYIASALMEWQQNNDLIVARKVFEIGLKKYITEPKYVMEYIKFLQHQNDKDNIRVLFERVIAAIPKEKGLEIWNEFLDFEYENGNIEAISNILKRRIEIYPELEISDFQLLINRFKFQDLYPIENIFNEKVENILPKSTTFIKPDTSNYKPIEPRKLISKSKRDDYIPDAVQYLLSILPTYDGPLPELDYVLNSLKRNDLPSIDSIDESLKKDYESDDDSLSSHSRPIDVYVGSGGGGVSSADQLKVSENVEKIHKLLDSQNIELIFYSQEIAQQISQLITLDSMEKRNEMGADCVEIIQRMSNILNEMKQTYLENKQELKMFTFDKKRISEIDIKNHEENIFKFKKKFIEIFMKGTYEGKVVEEVFCILKKRVQKEQEDEDVLTKEKIVPFVLVRNIETGLDEKIYLS